MSAENKTMKSDWIIFLEKFSNNQIKISFEESEKGYHRFIIENILDTGIEVSNKYGFLSLKFRNQNRRDKFLVHTEIKHEIQDFEKHKLISTKWLDEDYPCRVYFSDNRLILSFCDKEDNLNKDEKLNDRITVFKNVLSALVNLKIDDAKEIPKVAQT